MMTGESQMQAASIPQVEVSAMDIESVGEIQTVELSLPPQHLTT